MRTTASELKKQLSAFQWEAVTLSLLKLSVVFSVPVTFLFLSLIKCWSYSDPGTKGFFILFSFYTLFLNNLIHSLSFKYHLHVDNPKFTSPVHIASLSTNCPVGSPHYVLSRNIIDLRQLCTSASRTLHHKWSLLPLSHLI